MTNRNWKREAAAKFLESALERLHEQRGNNDPIPVNVISDAVGTGPTGVEKLLREMARDGRVIVVPGQEWGAMERRERGQGMTSGYFSAARLMTNDERTAEDAVKAAEKAAHDTLKKYLGSLIGDFSMSIESDGAIVIFIKQVTTAAEAIERLTRRIGKRGPSERDSKPRTRMDNDPRGDGLSGIQDNKRDPPPGNARRARTRRQGIQGRPRISTP